MSSMEFCEIEMETWKGRLERRFKTRLDFDNFSSGGMSTKTYYKNFDEYGLSIRSARAIPTACERPEPSGPELVSIPGRVPL